MMEGRHRAIQLYTVPVFSLASEEMEGYMNVLVVLASTTQTPLPPSAFHYQQGLPESHLSKMDPTELEQLHLMARELWAKIDDVIVTHKLMHMRVADILLRCFAAKISTHWPLFLSLFSQIHFADLGHILGFILKQYQQSSKVDSNQRYTTEDFHKYNYDFLVAKSNINFARINRTVAMYQDDIPTFVTVDDASSVNEKLKDKMMRDFNLIGLYVEKVLGDVSIPHLYLASALLLKHQLIELASLLSHFEANFSMYTPHFVEPKVVWEDVVQELNSSYNARVVEKEKECVQASILTSLLAIGDLLNAFKLIATYPEVNWCCTFPRVTEQFLRLLSYVVCPSSVPSEPQTVFPISKPPPTILTKVYPGKQVYFYPPWISQLRPGDINLVCRLLSVVGPLIYLHPPIAMHLCHLVNQGQLDELQILTGYLLPCVSLLQTPSPALITRVWHIIGKWNAPKRFALYHSMKHMYQSHPMLKTMEDHVRQVTRYWMKRISKEVVKAYSRKLCKLATGNPVPVLSHIVTTVMQYENLGGAILEALKFLDKMAMDVLLYTSLTALAEQAQSASVMKEDGSNLETWLLNLSQFLSAWIAEYSNIDFSALLSYLDHKDFGIADAHILSDLISQMTGIQVILDLPENLIKALECHDCVGLRVLVPDASKYASSCKDLVETMRIDHHYLRFLDHLKRLHSKLAMTRDWSDFEVIEKTTSEDLQNALQWRDRVQSYLNQYRWFLRFHLNYVEPPSPSSSVFDRLSLYHLHFDPSLYLPTESKVRDQHQSDYLATQALWNGSNAVPDTPSAHALFLRAIRSPLDSLFVIHWLTRCSSLPLSDITSLWIHSLWCVSGLTPMETTWMGRVLNYLLAQTKPMSSSYGEAVHEFIVFALKNSDLFLVRNALHLLTVITDVFPQEWDHAESIQEHLARHRDDPRLRVLVLVIEGSLNAWFKKQTKLGKRPPVSLSSTSLDESITSMSSKMDVDRHGLEVKKIKKADDLFTSTRENKL